ncbi:Phosphate import ATP-binding protein PstB 3 [Thalassoglobus polymorphus]|uniref:Phosphate import ATP-binding protein PstB 3 n=2 Tax=Thalassoglobus polymorphus TaxID=2527994 RepID=A0A517QMS3_9PLAN|nr:phosphate ABC transporter ATP-binding protein PstB [Thalassoglobus polymorphus]QDT32911.1 Phosphate import ATP-binding protein PstB 3 [Thalassoglobus polymorphus]
MTATKFHSFSELVQDRTESEPTVQLPEAPPVAPKLETQNLSFYYGTNQVLYDVSMKIAPKSVTALIGPSGCGKSTFLRTLNRMNDLIEGTHHTGTVLLENIDLNAPEIDVVALRKRIGMVFQKSTPFPKSIFDNVAFGPKISGLRNKKILAEIVEYSLKQSALWDEVKDRLNDSALALSGGQQQRLCVARTLATQPDVVLMDEPASALDPASTSRIEDLIFELKKDYTIVIVTHNMQQAARISDQTAFFYEGHLIEMGPTQELFTKPREKQTENYITGRFG